MTLAGLLPLLSQCPRLLIEIKSHPGEQSSGHACRLTEKVISMLTQPQYRNCQDRLLILSFDAEVLSLAHRLAPQFKKVLNLTGKEPDEAAWDRRFLWAIDVPIGKLTAPLIQKARGRGLRTMSYTCNGPRQVTRALRLGIDAIITDRPGWLTQQFGRW